MQINSLLNNYPVQNSLSSVMPYNKMDQASFLDYMKQATEAGSDAELSSIRELSKAYCVGKSGAGNFVDAFTRYDVTTHVGNANITDANWQRNDFPIWKYFEKGASADCLNDWRPSGPNPPQTDPNVQRGLASIGPGKMSIIIPDALQKKMDADPEYAKAIMQKVQKWKEDYDNWDNATALSLGMNVAENQASKNYLINLDEDGNVKQYAVSGGGGTIKGPSKEEQRQFEEEQKAKKEKKIKEEQERQAYNRRVAEQKRIFEEESLRRRNIESIIQSQIMTASEIQGTLAVNSLGFSPDSNKA